MKFTNKKNFPGVIVNAIIKVNSKYTRGNAHISTTQLIDSPLLRVLKLKHADEMITDVSDMLWSFFGTVSHEILANVESDDVIWKEKRLYVDIGGWKVSGQPDLYYKAPSGMNVLSDFKITAKYSFKNGPKPEYVKQLNIYRYMCECAGYKVDSHENIVIFRDALSHEDKVAVYPVVRYTLDKVKEYMEERVALHQACEGMDANDIAPCTPQERWQDDSKYCVVKKGNKNQTGGDYLKREDAEVFCNDLQAKHPKNEYSVRTKLQINKRCERFCSVSAFCWWWNGGKDEH